MSGIQKSGYQQRCTVLSTMAVLPTHGLYLHASAVIVNGGAVLFLGHSTAGKSTIACLLSPIYPILADDTVLVREGDSGQWLVTDGKIRFNGIEPCHSTDMQPPRLSDLPLHACVRIHKGPDLRREPLVAIELAQCLMDAVMEVDVQRKCGRLDPKVAIAAQDAISTARAMRGHWFHMAASIARTCPGRRLWFPHNADPHELMAAIGEDSSVGGGRAAFRVRSAK